MSRNWPLASIAECAANEPHSTQIGPFGDKIRAETYTSDGAPVLRGTNVNTDKRFFDDGFVFVDKAIAKTEFANFLCRSGDVILCHKGTLGKIGLIPQKSRFDEYVMGNSMMRVRCDPAKLLPAYLYYWLSSKDGTNYLLSRVSQVGVPQIQRPLTTLREARFPLPPLAVQHGIVEILGTLDDKIDLNRRANETMEELARALFKSWFIDFDSTDGKMLGEWSRRPLSEWSDAHSGGTPSKANAAFWGGDLPWISPKVMTDIHADEADAFVTPAAIGNGTRLVPKGSTLVMVRGMGLHQRVRVSQARRQVTFNQDVKALVPRDIEPSLLLFAMLDAQSELLGRVESSGHGTGVLPTEILLSHSIAMPPRDVQKEMAKPFDLINDRIAVAREESRTLAELRDLLLPRLLSGEIRVRDAERALEAVA